MRTTSLAVLALLCTACGTPGAAPAAATPLAAATLDSVRAVDAAFAAAMNARDTAAVMALYTTDGMLMPQDAPAMDMTAARGFLSGFMAAGATNFALNSTTTYGVGDVAYSVGTASFTLGGATDTVKYLEVLRRGADGKWRYAVDMFSNIAPPKAPAAAAAPAPAPAK